MKIAVHSKTFNQAKFVFIRQVFEELEKRNAKVLISAELNKYLEEFGFEVYHSGVFRNRHEIADCDLFISIGGDGTLLDAVTMVQDHEIPILGVNIGRLGFLATLSKDNIRAGIAAIFAGKYHIEERTLIRAEANEPIFGELNFALNDFTIVKRDSASMIVVHTFLDDEYLNSYWADGLIISTPTGSTAYSLSVGGPVVLPRSQSFIIAPISPHNLNVRPLVYPDDCKVSFQIEGRSNSFLVSLDSRSQIVDSSVRLSVRKADFTARLVRFEEESFIKTLRQKVNWGLDYRN